MTDKTPELPFWDTLAPGSNCRRTLKEKYERRKAYQQSEPRKKKRREYERRPENVEKRKRYNQRPQVKARQKMYYSMPDIRERRKHNARFHRKWRSILATLLKEGSLFWHSEKMDNDIYVHLGNKPSDLEARVDICKNIIATKGPQALQNSATNESESEPSSDTSSCEPDSE